LKGRPGELLAQAGDDVMATVVELEGADAGSVEPRRQLPDQRLPEENTDPRP